MSKRIRTLDQLENEIYRQKLKSKTLGNKLDENFEYLQHNYGSMFRNSFFKSSNTGESFAGTAFRSIFGNERVQDAFAKIANPLVERAAEWIDNLLGRMGRKEE